MITFLFPKSSPKLRNLLLKNTQMLGACTHSGAHANCKAVQCGKKLMYIQQEPLPPFAIPNENIRRCPRGQRTNPNDVAQAVNGNRNFVYAPGVFRIKQDITKDASYGRDGHAIHVVCHEIWKVWDVVPL